MVNTWRIVAAALVIFAAGVLTGGAGAGLATRFSRERKYAPLIARPLTNAMPRLTNNVFRAPGGARLELIHRLTRDLDLSEEQKTKLEPVFTNGQARLNALWDPVAPKAKAVYDEIRKEINSILTPEQKQRVDAALRRRSAPRVVSTNAVPAQ